MSVSDAKPFTVDADAWNKLQAKLNKYGDLIEKLDTDNAKKAEQMKVMADTINGLVDQNGRLGKELQTSSDMVQGLQGRVQYLETQNDVAQGEKNFLDGRVKDLTRKIGELEYERDQLKTENEELRQRLCSFNDLRADSSARMESSSHIETHKRLALEAQERITMRRQAQQAPSQAPIQMSQQPENLLVPRHPISAAAPIQLSQQQESPVIPQQPVSTAAISVTSNAQPVVHNSAEPERILTKAEILQIISNWKYKTPSECTQVSLWFGNILTADVAYALYRNKQIEENFNNLYEELGSAFSSKKISTKEQSGYTLQQVIKKIKKIGLPDKNLSDLACSLARNFSLHFFDELFRRKDHKAIRNYVYSQINSNLA